MTEAWAIAITLIAVMICATVIIISNRWADLTGVVIANNGTMMCQPVICTCDSGFHSIGYMSIYENITEVTQNIPDGDDKDGDI